MKKIFTAFASLILLASMAQAQTMSDALTFGRSDYYGTARTLGMGNAVTAVGGDMGTIAVNPAGGAVSSFSQFTFSTGWSTAGSSSSYAPSYDSYNQSANYVGEFKDSKTRMTIPNVGINLYFETGNRHGVLGWNFGVMVNRSQTFTRMFSGASTDGSMEGHTSMTGALASQADGMPGNILGNNGKYDTNYAWNSIVAYDGGLINYNNDAGTYYGSAETKTKIGDDYSYEMRGWLDQRIGSTTIGSKNDIIVNYGVNVDNRLFLGATINCPIINYRFSEFYSEVAPQNSTDFPVTPEYINGDGKYVAGDPTYYLGSTYKYHYSASISGINAKIGAIWLPTDGLRIGAAIQTPTAYTVNEEWYVDVESQFQDSAQNGYGSTPTAETTYDFRAPYSANFGIAYTIGRAAMLSVDYELTDFSVMKFSETYIDGEYSYEDPFYRVNRLNKLFCGVAHSVRAGVEFRALPSISLRAGINYSTSPVRHYVDNEGYTVFASDYDNWFDDYESGKYHLQGKGTYASDNIFAVTFGAGYSSPGSFYCDLAFKRTTLPDNYYQPYSNYLSHTVDGKVYDIVSPSVRSKLSLFDAVFTFGWRF